jgi:predicted membrane-bound spermidine synthase
VGAFRLALYALVLIVGILVGLEIPLVMRILKQQFAFKDLVSQVLTLDYLGALAVSLLFPILLAPHLGLNPHQPAVRLAQRAGGGLGAVAVPRTVAAIALAARSVHRRALALPPASSPPTGSPRWPKKICTPTKSC